MQRTSSLLLVVAIVAAACQGATPATPVPTAPISSVPATPSATATPEPVGVQSIDSAAFTNVGGCGDVFMWATNAEGTTAITVEWQGAATTAWEDGSFDETATVEEDPVVVTLVTGRGLDGLYCNDILMPGMAEDNKVQASAGTVRLVVRPDQEGFKPASHADAVLNDIVFEVVVGTEEESWQLDELGFENLSVGWMAG